MIGKIGQHNILNSSQNIQDVRETGQLGDRVVKVSRHRIAQEKQSEIDGKTASGVYLSMRVLADDVDNFLKPLDDIRLYPERLHKYIKYDGNTPYIEMGAVKAKVFNYTSQRLIVFYGVDSLRDLHFISKNMMGFGKKEMEDALFIISSFKNKSNTTLVGHSMGGVFATYAGVKTGMKVVNFNALGLANRTVKKLQGDYKCNNIINVNSKNDWVNEKINPKFKLNQIGKRFFVDSYENHNPITGNESILTSIRDYIEKEQSVRF